MNFFKTSLFWVYSAVLNPHKTGNRTNWIRINRGLPVIENLTRLSFKKALFNNHFYKINTYVLLLCGSNNQYLLFCIQCKERFTPCNYHCIMGTNLFLKPYLDFYNYLPTISLALIHGIKVHIFWEGHKILRNLHLTFVWL